MIERFCFPSENLRLVPSSRGNGRKVCRPARVMLSTGRPAATPMYPDTFS